jgi:hypothetical protein
MGLRNYINDLEFSKKINYSEKGRKFEHSDFARCGELTARLIKADYQEHGLKKKTGAILSALFFPVSYCVIYKAVQNEKKMDPSFCSARPYLALNH